MHLDNIKISVIIPVYNCGAYLAKAINSITSQTHTNFELLICDDGSVDNSLSIAQAYAERDNRIKVLVNEKNEGHIYTYNRLFFASTGEYVMILDSDDWSAPDRIEKQTQACIEHQADLCFCASAFYYVGSDQPNYGITHPSGYVDIFSAEHYDPATIFFKRSILQAVPGFHTYFDRLVAMDRYFILSCLHKFKGYYLNEPLYHVLFRPDSDHRSLDERYMRKLTAVDAYRLLKKQRQDTGTDWLEEGKEEALLNYEQKLLENKQFISEKYRIFSCIQIDNHRTKEGWRLLKKAMWLNPVALANFRSVIYLLKTIIFN